FTDADQCRKLEFTPEKAFDGRRLINHVIRTVEIMEMDFCEKMCYMEPDCVSINLEKRAGGNGGYKCELNNVTHEGHERELKMEDHYFYRAADSACFDSPCGNKATCQSGFTDKGYRCLCTSGFKGPNCKKDVNECADGTSNCSADAVCKNTKGSYRCKCKPGFSGDGKTCKTSPITSCKEQYAKDSSCTSEVYPLMFGSQKIPVYCHMGDFGCGDGGWTLAMKIDGKKGTFHYDSHFWSDKNSYNLLGGKTGFDSQETKLPTYWKTPFSKICLVMRIGPQKKFIVMRRQANSLFSLLADGKYRNTTIGRSTWKTLIGLEASLQPNCNKDGFNAMGSAKGSSRARIGFLGNNEGDCVTPDSRIGFGTGGYHDDTNTCGNEALDHPSSDNGGKHIKAMGYILVQ
ncbi:uncharacterized protein LOC111346494, partial [Stylophora pistillata]|uniref:uncharacterized protein LOC111346494 n=1 Tax=Stylophora pistillata TaxID=50429 RepID=UPI000C03D7B3